jgi:predicted enzyme related to lactoylglutathione lyase
MQKVSGFGGFFFRARDPEALSHWYENQFGINSMSSDAVWRQEAGPTVFAPFPSDTDYFGHHEQAFMINFRVNDLDAMLEQLQAASVRIDETRMEETNGRFAWVYDPEGNKIELWEPSDERTWEEGNTTA